MPGSSSMLPENTATPGSASAHAQLPRLDVGGARPVVAIDEGDAGGVVERLVGVALDLGRQSSLTRAPPGSL